MCGIVGYIGKNNVVDAIVDGLHRLEYRGYDSAGISIVKDKKIVTYKDKGRVVHLSEIIPDNNESNIGIGHTRWATHGKPLKKNAHPHQRPL